MSEAATTRENKRRDTREMRAFENDIFRDTQTTSTTD
jgi:hypothetical protein